MQFNHDNMTGPLLAAELANLARQKWDLASAARILDGFGIRRASLTSASSEQLRQWSQRLFSAFDTADAWTRCSAVNGLLQDGTSRAYLTMHDQLRPHLHFAPDDDDVVARVMAVTAGGLAIFMVESEGGRLGVCAREGCRTAFVDTSRNGRRSYCSARCGNTDAVRRHRQGRDSS